MAKLSPTRVRVCLLQLVPLIIRSSGVHHFGQPLSKPFSIVQGNKQNHLPIDLCESLWAPFPRLSHPYLVFPLKRRCSGCAPAAHTTRSGPRAAAAAAEIKEKETKHHGKRSSPFKAPKTRQAHASLLLHSGVGERGAKGEEVLFSPPHAPPHPIPQVLQEPKGHQWRIKGDAFPRAPHYPSNARWYFAFLKFRPLRPLPPN